ARTRRPRDGRRRVSGRPMTAELARVGGPIACAGLALLFVGRGRRERLAGLALAVVGAAALVVYLAPHGHRPVLAAAAFVGLVGAAARAAVFRRWPWLFALAALASSPGRSPCSSPGAACRSRGATTSTRERSTCSSSSFPSACSRSCSRGCRGGGCGCRRSTSS